MNPRHASQSASRRRGGGESPARWPATLLAPLLLLASALLPAPVGAQRAPAVVAREYRAPSVSAKDGSPLTIALTEKYRADLDPTAQAASGRIVLLAHGLSVSGLATFDVQVPGVPPEGSWSVMDQLALRGYDVWTVAVQGYRQSDRHDCGLCVTTEAAAGDVEAAVRFVLAARRADRLHLLGYSWGGQTAGLVAGRHPELVNRLVLAAPVTDRGEGDPPTEQFSPNTPALAGYFHPTGAVPEVVAAFVEAAVAAEPVFPSGGAVDILTDPRKADPRRLTAPTLVIYGADDEVTPVGGPNVRPFFEALAATEKRFVVVPGGATWCSWSGRPGAGWRRCWPTSSRATRPRRRRGGCPGRGPGRSTGAQATGRIRRSGPGGRLPGGVAAGRYVPAMRPGPLPLLRFLGERPMVTEVAVRFRRAG
jgi:pimeloyl-ACP methyl ester carboxylesterase